VSARLGLRLTFGIACLILITVAAYNVTATTRSQEAAFVRPSKPKAHRDPLPAVIAKDIGPWFSSDTIWPITNSWATADRRSYTAVQAGVDPYDKSRGVLAIFRQGAGRKGDVLHVSGSGPLRITRGPLGRSVETWAQKHGNIQFTSTHGVTGTLHLKNDSVTLDP
jgi:hypothetical protein